MSNRSVHRYAVFVAVSTLVLIFIGGLVTSTGSGLSVPDWPLSYGKFFPKMVGGVAYEHGHRMAAALVGFLTVILAVLLWKANFRKGTRLLGIFAVGAVIAQGVLGGMTVLFRLPVLLSVGHAGLAQIFLCLNVAIAISTSEGWQREPIAVDDSRTPSLRGLATFTTIVVFVQIILGALMRHTGGGLSIPDFPLSYGRLAPPFFTAPILFNYAHRLAGLAVIVCVLWYGSRVLRIASSESSLRIPAFLLIGSLLVQVVLGAATIWSRKAPIPTTLHVMCGALTLASCVWLSMSVFRILSPRPARRGVQVAAA